MRSKQMEATELLNYTIPSLKPQDTIGQAIEIMEFNGLEQLALVDMEVYCGLISLDMLENNANTKSLLEDLLPEFVNTFAKPNQHIIELLNIVQQNDIDVLAVVDENVFKGSIAKNDLFVNFSHLFGNEIGAIVVLNIKERDYSLSEIARLIESNDTKVLASIYHNSNNDGGNVLTLKLNRRDISRTIATLERFGYDVLATYANEPVESIEKERYDMLIKYLEI